MELKSKYFVTPWICPPFHFCPFLSPILGHFCPNKAATQFEVKVSVKRWIC